MEQKNSVSKQKVLMCLKVGEKLFEAEVDLHNTTAPQQGYRFVRAGTSFICKNDPLISGEVIAEGEDQDQSSFEATWGRLIASNFIQLAGNEHEHRLQCYQLQTA